MSDSPNHVSISGKKIKELNDASPGGGDRFLQEVIAQLEADRKMSEARQRADQASRTRGQWLGFTVAVIGLIFGLIAALNKAETAASFIGVGPIVVMVGVFVLGRWPWQKDKPV